MGLFQFTSQPSSMLSNEMLNLRSRLGGTAGTIRNGMDRLDVVKVAENVYVTAARPTKALEAMVNLGGADIHLADHPADLQLIKDRLKAFIGGPFGPGFPAKQNVRRT